MGTVVYFPWGIWRIEATVSRIDFDGKRNVDEIGMSLEGSDFLAPDALGFSTATEDELEQLAKDRLAEMRKGAA